MLVTGNQLKAARALAGVDEQRVADSAGVNVNTIRNMEAQGSKPITSSAVTVRRVQLALEALGTDCSITPSRACGSESVSELSAEVRTAKDAFITCSACRRCWRKRAEPIRSLNAGLVRSDAGYSICRSSLRACRTSSQICGAFRHSLASKAAMLKRVLVTTWGA